MCYTRVMSDCARGSPCQLSKSIVVMVLVYLNRWLFRPSPVVQYFSYSLDLLLVLLFFGFQLKFICEIRFNKRSTNRNYKVWSDVLENVPGGLPENYFDKVIFSPGPFRPCQKFLTQSKRKLRWNKWKVIILLFHREGKSKMENDFLPLFYYFALIERLLNRELFIQGGKAFENGFKTRIIN